MSDDIRKSQITGTFGVGSLRVQLGGLSMIAAGLDHWYQDYTLTRQMQKSRPSFQYRSPKKEEGAPACSTYSKTCKDKYR